MTRRSISEEHVVLLADCHVAGLVVVSIFKADTGRIRDKPQPRPCTCANQGGLSGIGLDGSFCSMLLRGLDPASESAARCS